MRSQNPAKSARSIRAAGGFTLVELLTVVVIMAILVGMLSAGLNRTRVKAQQIVCVDNLKQLQAAWQMYTDENDDRIPLNTPQGAPEDKVLRHRLSTNSWAIGNPREDITTANLEAGSIYRYIRNTAIYKCPLEDAEVLSRPGKLRNRSYSISGYLASETDPKDPRVKLRLAEVRLPSPSGTFAFIEESAFSVWFNAFVVPPKESNGTAINTWASSPGELHQSNCNLTFVDGHVESWRWMASRKDASQSKLSTSGGNLRDLRRLQSVIPKN